MKNRRVVITGIGIIAPNGIGKEEFWHNLCRGKSGIGRITLFDASSFPCQIAGEIKDFRVNDFVEARIARRTARFTHFAIAATKMAVEDSGISELNHGENTDIYLGTAAGGMDIFEHEHVTLREKGVNRMSPFGSAAYFTNSPATEISIELGCKGEVTTLSTACTSGLDAIGLGFKNVQKGKVKMAIAGGTDAPITPLTIGSLCAAKIMSVQNESPERASRPFDKKRDGGVISEGAAIVILEELEHALERKAKIYGEIKGYASNGEASSLFESDCGGNGFVETMELALGEAKINRNSVDYICAHAPSDRIRDAAETNAIKQVLGKPAYRIPVSSVKSMVGNPLSSAGPIQVVASVLAMQTSTIPPTINYEYPDPECDLDYVPNIARKNQVGTVLINSHGFGGNNSSLILRKYVN